MTPRLPTWNFHLTRNMIESPVLYNEDVYHYETLSKTLESYTTGFQQKGLLFDWHFI
jgi:hypothetical protein